MELPDKKKYSKNLGSSLKNSIAGLFLAIDKEASLKILFFLSLLLLFVGFLFQISSIEWLFIVLMIGCCFSAELFNTSIENVVDLATKEIHPLAKAAKDTASAAELVFLFMSIVMICIIFIPKIVALFVG